MRKRLTAQGAAGRQSYTVTLPIEWIKEHKLEKKREVELDLVGQHVIISTQSPENIVVIDGNIYRDGIVKILRALYRRGVDEIHFKAKDEQQAARAREVIDRFLIGYEIIEQRGDTYVIRDITGEDPEGFRVALRRAFLLLLTISEDYDEATFRSLQKLCVYAQRILLKHGHDEYQKTPLYYIILDRLEKIADEYNWLSERGDKETRKKLTQLLRTAYEVLHKFDGKAYFRAQEGSYRLKNKLEGKNRHQYNIARQINSLLGDIFAAVGE